ncbi:hypothetical protein BX616_006379 [Lobosporangium transversale]|uniref:Uncharacterized protein n=1 Tax=Lobosporangium transversale TaxID=64571 RepID=A0A1Y2GA61_9FUNG|nr:hypothetical protein BCR41DRAFT_425557 [Lobosporangium transversale]KAF9915335.1 hypothetical protein BX616_006379 [Lobosporangium transversale]ORZ05327.1 hypothetical protein BCR41DRAFT_425557 [Lobosporangium transversale]|eukprot:XP_021877019.1 hypothetical protein BCR41DRAFT_425557 [Lobosporangium transversale]
MSPAFKAPYSSHTCADAASPWCDNNEAKTSKDSSSSVTARRPMLYKFMDSLENSIFFSGVGSLSHDVESMKLKLAADNTLVAKCDQTPQQRIHFKQERDLETSLSTVAPRADDAFSWLNWLTSDANSMVLKRYRITIEELPELDRRDCDASHTNDRPERKGVKQIETKSVIEHQQGKPWVATAVTKMPPSMMSWILRYTMQNPYHDNVSTFHYSTDADHNEVLNIQRAETTVTPQTKEDDAFNPLEDSFMGFLAMDNNTKQGTSNTSTEATDQVGSPLDTDHELVSAVASSTAAIVASTSASASPSIQLSAPAALIKDTEQGAELPPTKQELNHGDQSLPWWQLRRHCERNLNKRYEQEESRAVHIQKKWPQRHRPLRQGESFTQTTVTRPDGTVESRMVSYDRETDIVETRTRVQYSDGSIQESVIREGSQKLSSDSSSPARVLFTKHQQKGQEERSEEQTADASQGGRRQQPVEIHPFRQQPDEAVTSRSFRERMAQRHQERAERRAERHRERQERRQELRDVEARQREAIAAAYGFNTNANNGNGNDHHNVGDDNVDSASTTEDSHRAHLHFHRLHDPQYRSTWHQRHEDHERERSRLRRQQGEEEATSTNKEYQNIRQSWPPRGYLRRLGKEQENGQEHGSRHNI